MISITAEHRLALERINHPEDAALMATGEWPGDTAKNTVWGLYLSEHQPVGVITTAAAGVAIRNLQNREVVLTLNPEEDEQTRKNMWEIPAGHIEPVEPDNPHSPLEDSAETLVRECLEETGFQTASEHLRRFGYMLMLNPPESSRPETGCMPYFYTVSSPKLPLLPATDPSKPMGGIFPEWSIERMVANKLMEPLGLVIIRYGLEAALHTRQRETL